MHQHLVLLNNVMFQDFLLYSRIGTLSRIPIHPGACRMILGVCVFLCSEFSWLWHIHCVHNFVYQPFEMTDDCYTQHKSLQSVSTWAIGSFIHCHLVHDMTMAGSACSCKNNHYLSICIQECKTTKILVNAIISFLLPKSLSEGYLINPPPSCPLCSSELYNSVRVFVSLPTFSRTPLKYHLLQIVGLHMYVFLSVLSSHLSLGLHWSPLPPVLLVLNTFVASLSSFVTRFLARLS